MRAEHKRHKGIVEQLEVLTNPMLLVRAQNEARKAEELATVRKPRKVKAHAVGIVD